MKQIELEVGTSLPFKWMDNTPGGNNLGHAEFIICVKYRKGKVREFWVYPKQQRNSENFWHWVGGDISFCISSYQGLEDAKVWRTTWCEEHKTPSLHLYVPKNSKYLYIDYHGISFLKTPWHE